MEELGSRVKAGEEEAKAKRDIQLRKARACEERKQSAVAVVNKTTAQLNPKPKAKAVPQPPAESGDSGPNKAYYMEVQEDLATVLGEFKGLEAEMPLGISASNSGVQEPYDMGKCKLAIGVCVCMG